MCPSACHAEDQERSLLLSPAHGSLDQMARSPVLQSGDWVRIPTYPLLDFQIFVRLESFAYL